MGKKKLEGDVIDLDCSLEHANAANAETQRNIKTYQLGLREAQSKLEAEQVAKERAHDALINTDRKCNSNQNALEQADRARRMVEQELADTNESLSDQTCTNQAIQASKMKIESEMATLSSDL